MAAIYLLTQPWYSSFDVANDKLHMAVVWIRLPGLPMHWYQDKMVKRIGVSGGNVIKVDINTTDEVRGKYVRLAVAVDLYRLLVSKVQVRDRV